MKKSVLCLVLCLLVCFVLSACKYEEGEVNTSNITENNETSVDVIDFKGDYLDEYKNTEVEEVRKFFGTAIVNVRPKEYRKFDIPIISETDEGANLVSNLLHLELEWLEEYAMSVSQSNTRAYTVAIVKPKVEYIENVISAVSLRLNDLERTMVNYPDQMYLVENAIVEQVGDYLVILVCDNSDEVFKQIYNVMSSCDLGDLKEVSMMTEEERKSIEDKALNEEISKLSEDIEEVVVTPYVEPEVEEPIEEPVEEENISE